MTQPCALRRRVTPVTFVDAAGHDRVTEAVPVHRRQVVGFQRVLHRQLPVGVPCFGLVDESFL